ncbi:MAG: hypothetical protein KC414_14135 [Romboutsia sp.]|nr:hypothetical protein [Romboutsia sp.]
MKLPLNNKRTNNLLVKRITQDHTHIQKIFNDNMQVIKFVYKPPTRITIELKRKDNKYITGEDVENILMILGDIAVDTWMEGDIGILSKKELNIKGIDYAELFIELKKIEILGPYSDVLKPSNKPNPLKVYFNMYHK